MEKIPAACALSWSLKLEKGLRSREPDKYSQTLDELGVQLEMWNTDAEIPSAAYAMYSLIPGEDKLFLNAIFLRLIDAFHVGTKQIKKRIVKLFLRIKRKAETEAGILVKDKLENYLQLLTKVKQVYDEGDSEERALALSIFGCWCYLVKDCVDARYIVLASLVSSDVHEAKAALFAARSLCEVSDHFAFVFLEVLASAILSGCVSRDIKLAGARSFSKMWHSLSLADRAYKTGSKLLKDSDGDDFTAVMLISLTRIASRWTFLLPAQMDLLSSFLSEEISLDLKLTTLRCYHLILPRGASCLLQTSETCDKLFGLLNTLELQPLHLEALKLLRKILQVTVSTVPDEEMTEIFHKLLAVTTNMLKSSIIPVRTLAVSILIDLCGNVLRRKLIPVELGDSVTHLAISLILDQVLVIMTSSIEGIQAAECSAELDVKNLLHYIFYLVRDFPDIAWILLKNISLFIGEFIRIIDKKTATEQSSFSHEKIMEVDSDDKALIESETLIFVSKIIASCLYGPSKNDLQILEVVDDLKCKVDHICRCGFFGNYTCLTYTLLFNWKSSTYMHHEIKTPPVKDSSFHALYSISKLDECALAFASGMFVRNSYYSAYKAGKVAACQGAWSTAAFIFEKLAAKVRSVPCSTWIRFLWQFSTSEKQFQSFLLPKQGDSLGEWAAFHLKTCFVNYMENLLRASSTLFVTQEILEASESRHRFTFQRWFLYLREKFLKVVADLSKLLYEKAFVQDVIGTGEEVDRNYLHPCRTQTLALLIHSSIQLSREMNMLAQQYDLLLTSFMVKDVQSRMTISALAMTCSLLAFTVGFSFLVPDLNHSGSCKVPDHENKQKPFQAFLVSDLIMRLRPNDNISRKSLLFLLNRFYKDMLYDLKGLQNKSSCNSPDTIWLYKLCDYSVGEIFNIQKEVAGVQCNDDTLSQAINKSSKLLLEVVSKVILTPFQAPRHLFCARPPASYELFVMNEDGKTVSGISVPSGQQLSLNCCLQISHFADNPVPSYVHCIITCQSKFIDSVPQADKMSEAQQIEDMTELNARLWKYIVFGCADDASSAINEYVCFRVNERGQGFSTCLLDVSDFPLGSYIIKWHTGFVDSSTGAYWNMIPLNCGPLFNIVKSETQRFP